ncbi:HAMP domain-containing histidine kinase [Streptomyces sp. TRM66268-LWL]|uniref:histidine kinase n=1 Tax=Streptomyces polyasparticus TaxID=2767826 RepID=A0ABR7SPP1_9ACTN|nr:HAMP domain-containing sensor histidine kinase [Streptomyces polyasparticus]MBC9717451.1 HAMP domain-containing histidine kinase [Streptomyces polyasparticus]
MTRDPRTPRSGARPPGGLGPLGRRLFAAFAVVALASVALLTIAALVGTDRGISSARQEARQSVAAQVATAAADAFRTAGDWASADLSTARSVAEAADAVLTVRDTDGKMIFGGSGVEREPGMSSSGPGHGRGAGSGPSTSTPVVVDGSTVGSVRVVFPAGSGSTGRSVAWGWVTAAAAGAVALALVVSWFVTRRLTFPVVRVAATARALAAGDRTARTQIDAPGELGDLARAFDAMADNVAHTEQTRHRLAADVAHELRTPLASLQAGLEELRDGYVDASVVRLVSLHDQALRLSRIVGDLGELAEAESARLSLHLAEVDLAALAGAAVAEREAELRSAGLTVHSAPGPTALLVRADGDRLHQALGNLLSNAARHCRPGDTVTVTTSATPFEALVEVADSGPGIPAEELPHVFDRLWRGTRARAGGGSGIGLAVVKELVTAHGGTVTADSGPDGGTRLTLRLPRVAPHGSRHLPGPGVVPRRPGKYP